MYFGLLCLRFLCQKIRRLICPSCLVDDVNVGLNDGADIKSGGSKEATELQMDRVVLLSLLMFEQIRRCLKVG